MTTLIVALLLVMLIDQSVKLLLWRRLSQAMPLCRLRVVGVIPARLWLAHVARGSSLVMTWMLWAVLAVMLVIVSTWVPSSRLFVGVLLGGSLSNALESSLRGIVTDYVCFRFWPAFNMADAALTAGAIGLLAQLLILAGNIIVR